MKKTIFLLAVLAAWCGRAAAEGLTVQNITIPKGGEATLEIALENPTTEFAAFQFNVDLASGITVGLNAKGKLDYTKGERLDEDFTLSMSQPDTEVNSFRVLGYYTETQAIPETGGTIIQITLKADAALEVGTELACKLSGINLTETDEMKHTPDDIAFTVTVGAPADTRTILDETSTTAPEAATGVDVRVKRTIKANEWSTLCLPFAMTAAQVTAAFGDDVQLADFTSWTSEEDDDTGDIVSIEVSFTAISTIAANHPCLIKVSKAIEEFTVDGVDIDPEDEPSIKVGRNKATRGFFTGTYVAGTAVPENNLFLSGNKFWYSTGATTTKAFRGYFELADVLTSVEEGAGTKVRFSIDGETTAIRSIENGEQRINNEDGIYYTLDGRKLNGKPMEKGMYIVNGKKVLKK